MTKKSEYKLRILEDAKRKLKGPSGGATGSREYLERVEKMRSQLLQKAAEGGAPKASRIKSELTCLLNNYLPSYDQRILMLIEEWRRSGDPEYDPGVRVTHRKARQAHMKDDNPF